MAETDISTEVDRNEQPLSQESLKKRQQQMLDDVDQVTQQLHQMSQQQQAVLQAYQNVPEEEVELLKKLQTAQEGVQKAMASQMSLRRDLDKVKEELAPLTKRRDALDGNIASRTLFGKELEELNDQINRLEFRHKEYGGYLENQEKFATKYRNEIPKLQDELFEKEERRLTAALQGGPTHPTQTPQPQPEVPEESNPNIRTPQQILKDVAELEQEMSELGKGVEDLVQQSRSVGTQLQEQQDAQRKELAGPPAPQRVFTPQEQAEAAVLQRLSDTQRKLQEARLAEMNQRRELTKLKEREKELTEDWKGIPNKSLKQASKADLEKDLEEVRDQQKKCENNLGTLGKQVGDYQEQIEKLQDQFSELDQGVPLEKLASYQTPEDRVAGQQQVPEVSTPKNAPSTGEHHSVREMLQHEHAHGHEASWTQQLTQKLRQAVEQLRQFFQKSPDSPQPQAKELDDLKELSKRIDKNQKDLQGEETQQVQELSKELVQGLDDVDKMVRLGQKAGVQPKLGEHVDTATAGGVNHHPEKESQGLHRKMSIH